MIRDLLIVIWGYLFPAWRASLRRETMNLFGVSLSSGIPLDEAIRLAAQNSPWPPLRKAFAALRQAQAAGYELHNALRLPGYTEIPALYRAIIGSNLSDREKGVVLQVKGASTDSAWIRPDAGLAYLGVEFIFGAFFLLQIGLFVLPQFQEIFRGLRAPLPILTQWVFAATDLMAGIGIFLVIIPILLIKNWDRMTSLLCGEARTLEVIEVLRILQGLEFERVPHVLGILGHPMVLPHTAPGFRRMADCLASREPLDDALRSLQVEPLARWILGQAVRGPESSHLFLEAADLLETRMRAGKKRLQVFLENALVIAMGTLLAVICTGVMLPMIRLLELL